MNLHEVRHHTFVVDDELKAESDAFKQMLNHARPQPAIDSWLEIQKIYYRHVQEILIGGATPQDAMEAATREINGVLKK